MYSKLTIKKQNKVTDVKNCQKGEQENVRCCIYIETSQLICTENQLTGLYVTGWATDVDLVNFLVTWTQKILATRRTSMCLLWLQNLFKLYRFNPFRPSVAFYIETSYLICTANQMTGFYMKRNTGLKWVEYWSNPKFTTEVRSRKQDEL